MEYLSQADKDSVLAEIAGSPVLLHEKDRAFQLTLPYDSKAHGSIAMVGNVKQAYVSGVEVPDCLRNNGIGERLIKCLFRYCLSKDVEVVKSTIVNPIALRIRSRVLGEEALHYLNPVYEGYAEIPITTEQACMSIVRAEALEEQYIVDGIDDEVDTGFTVDVNLSEVSSIVYCWELPRLSPQY